MPELNAEQLRDYELAAVDALALLIPNTRMHYLASEAVPTIVAEIRRLNEALAEAQREAAQAVLDAVEAVHSPSADTLDLYLHMDADETCEVCELGGHPCTVCEGCYPSHEGMDGYSVYPCASLRAARAAAARYGAGTAAGGDGR